MVSRLRSFGNTTYLFIIMLMAHLGIESAQGQSPQEQMRLFYESGESAFNRYLRTYSNTDYEQSVESYSKAISAADTLNTMLADSHHKLGILYQIYGNLPDALAEYHKAVTVKKTLSPGVDSVYFKELVLIGNIHYFRESYDSAEYYYFEAGAIEEKFEKLYERKRLFNSLGAFYYSLGDYHQAINHYSKAAEALETNDEDYAYDKLICQSNIAIAQVKLGRYEEAIRTYRELLQGDVPAQPAFYVNLGVAYFREHQYDSAETMLRKGLNQRSSLGRLNTLNLLGQLHLQRGNVDSAEWYLRKSVETNLSEFGTKNRYLAEAYRYLAEATLTRQDYPTSLDYYQKALVANTSNFDDEDTKSNPGKGHQPISVIDQSLILQHKGQVLVKYYEQNQKMDYLKQALNCFQEAIRVAQYTQKTYDNEEAKLFFVNQVHSLYENAISSAYRLYQQSKDNYYAKLALQFSEKSKASVLTEILREVDIKTSGEINDSLIDQERLVKQQITASRLKLIESSDSTLNETYRQKINDLEVTLARVVKRLQQDEKYYQLKYQEDSLNFEKWQSQMLGEDDLLLEYFMGEEQIYIFAVSSDSLNVQEVTLDSTFSEAWNNIQKHLFAYQYGDKYNKVWSSQLYQRLIAPVASQMTGKTRIIIIPAGELSYLPFEMLAPDAESDQYLLHKYSINYAFSGTLLFDAHQRRTVKAKNQEVLAMAPFAGRNVRSARNNALSPLYFSRQEVASVGGSLYLEEEATKQLFLKIAGSYNILHLATHASVNDQNPLQSFIAFYPQNEESITGYRLYTHELYNLRLDSVNLVVLSSCDAGNGRLVKGEGIISLARAFAYAGCPNIMTTLWKADDKAAAEIASQMHHYLKNGLAKDEALRRAKLDFLRDPENKDLKTPYYWANFVFIGDPAPIYDSYSWGWWIVSGMLTIIAIGVILVLMKRWLRSRKQVA